MKNNIKYTVETITPAIAEKYLTKVSGLHQRKLMNQVVKQYANAMRGGHWRFTHQGIAFDDQGHLIDGQHRLHAVVASGVPIEVFVTQGLPSSNDASALDVIDCGRIRGIGEHLAIQYGYRANGNIMAAACNSIQHLCFRGKMALTMSVTIKIIELYGVELEWCWKNISDMRALRSGVVMGAAAFCLKGAEKKGLMKEFYSGLMTGADLVEGAPALTLRNFLLEGIHERGEGSKRMTRPTLIRKSVCGAAMHHMAGTTLGRMRIGDLGVDFFADKQKELVGQVKKAMGVEAVEEKEGK